MDGSMHPEYWEMHLQRSDEFDAGIDSAHHSDEFRHSSWSDRNIPREPLSVRVRYGNQFQIPAPPVRKGGPLGPVTFRDHVDMEEEIRRSKRQ